MGIKMRLWILFICLSFSIALHAQRNNQFKQAKGIALCECIRQMNLLADSASVTGQKDYSISYFLQMTDLHPLLIKEILDYVRDNYIDYVETSQEIGGNMIGLSCWEFYHSKKLDANIRRIIRHYKRLAKKEAPDM